MANRVLKIIIESLLLACCAFGVAGRCCAIESQPSIFVSPDTYEFAPVPAGQTVQYDFLVGNKGSSPLLIERVESDCGCTTMAYPRQIAAGDEGKITVRLNTIDYGGSLVKKYIEVFSNDPEIPVLTLTLKGIVDKFVDIDPITARLKGPAGTEIKSAVTITPSEKYPFKILEMKAQKGNDIRFFNRENRGSDGSERYILTIENRREAPGRYFDVIHLKTDSQIQPELKVFVFGDIGTALEKPRNRN